MRADADLDEFLFRQQYLDGERGREVTREEVVGDEK
jgi:hypothetical protein